MKRKRIDPKAERVVAFLNNLTHSSGKFGGQPFHLRPWQEKIVRELFKADPATGLRQYRTCLLMLPRKNGKTELVAGMGLYGLLGDGEIGAQVVLAAADREQAGHAYKAAVAMVKADEDLARMCELVESQKRIVHRASGSVLQAISSEAYTKHGFNASMVIVDELHAWPKRELWDVLRTSQGGRSEPMMVAISTAGHDRHSILWQIYDYACKVRDGIVDDPSFLPVIYEAAKDADWLDERVWAACNPALGDFRSLEDMRILAREAKEMPGAENSFRQLYLNQWTEQAVRWMPIALWDACQTLIDWESYRGRRCFIGMDLSSTRDLTALAACFPDDEGGFDVLPAFFVPEDNIRERENQDRVPYGQWVKEGFLNATPGNVVDYRAVRAKVHEWGERYDIQEIGYDSWNAHDLIPRLSEDGFRCERVAQGFPGQTSPTKQLERCIASKAMRHDGHPVLRWNVGNAAVERDRDGNVMVSKKVSTEKIDGVRAMTNAIARMDLKPVSNESVYERRGLTTV